MRAYMNTQAKGKMNGRGGRETYIKTKSYLSGAAAGEQREGSVIR